MGPWVLITTYQGLDCDQHKVWLRTQEQQCLTTVKNLQCQWLLLQMLRLLQASLYISSKQPPYLPTRHFHSFSEIHCHATTSRKQGFGSGLASPLEPVQPRTGTLGGIRPGSCSQGASRASWDIGTGSSECICPGSLQEPVPIPSLPGPQPLSPVCD